MEDPYPLTAALLLLLVVISAFFSFAGTALAMARKSRLRFKAGGSETRPPETRSLAPVLETLEKPGALAFALRMWNLLTRLIAGALAASSFPSRPFPLTIALLAVLFMVFSELLPRFAASLNPEGILLGLFPLLRILVFPWKGFYLLALGIPFFKKSPTAPGEEELLLALEEREKTGTESRERSMVEGVLYLGDRPVSAFMTHRSEIEWLHIDAGPEEVRKKALECRAQGFFPVVRGTQDNIAGVVSVQDIFIALAEEWRGLAAIMKKPRFIPETLSALKAFEAFKRKDERYLCVMDEYGGFAGSLMIGDLIEEIVGSLTDPSAEEEGIILQEDGTWLADGSVSADEMAEALGLEDLGEENSRDYHTLAGFILKLAGDIPRTGESFSWENFRFTVVDLDGNRIDKVLIREDG